MTVPNAVRGISAYNTAHRLTTSGLLGMRGAVAPIAPSDDLVRPQLQTFERLCSAAIDLLDEKPAATPEASALETALLRLSVSDRQTAKATLIGAFQIAESLLRGERPDTREVISAADGLAVLANLLRTAIPRSTYFQEMLGRPTSRSG